MRGSSRCAPGCSLLLACSCNRGEEVVRPGHLHEQGGPQAGAGLAARSFAIINTVLALATFARSHSQVMGQLADLSEDDVFEELDLLEHTGEGGCMLRLPSVEKCKLQTADRA